MPLITANGDGDEIVVGQDADKAWFHADGTFGAGTLSWSFKGADGNWHPLTLQSTLTADYDEEFPTPTPLLVRPTLAGATGANIYYEAR